jgi:hypothetical protein
VPGMKTYIFLILILFLCTTAGYAQNTTGGTAYLLFDDSRKEICQQNIDELKKFRKVDTRKTFTFFHVCSELFVFNKEGSIPDTTAIRKIPKNAIVDISEMIKKYKSLEPQQFKHHVYDTLYIVEKFQKGQVLIYRVGWNDRSLGIVN